MIHFLIGACLLINGYNYKVVGYGRGTYILEQKVIVFEERRAYTEQWRKEWVNINAEKVECKKPAEIPEIDQETDNG